MADTQPERDPPSSNAAGAEGNPAKEPKTMDKEKDKENKGTPDKSSPNGSKNSSPSKSPLIKRNPLFDKDTSDKLQETVKPGQTQIDPQKLRDREEKVRQARERQAHERQKKLEEIREAQKRAQEFRDRQQEDRRRKIQEMRKREEERRNLVEERRKKVIASQDEKRKQLLDRFNEREKVLDQKRSQKGVVLAFGSRTPRTAVDTIPMNRLSLSASTNILPKSDEDAEGGSGAGNRLGAMSVSTTNLVTNKSKRLSLPPQRALSSVNLSSPDKGDNKNMKSKYKPPSPKQTSPRKAVSTVNLSSAARDKPDRNKTFTVSPKRASSHLNLDTTKRQPKRATPSPHKAISYVSLNRASPAKSDKSDNTASTKDASSAASIKARSKSAGPEVAKRMKPAEARKSMDRLTSARKVEPPKQVALPKPKETSKPIPKKQTKEIPKHTKDVLKTVQKDTTKTINKETSKTVKREIAKTTTVVKETKTTSPVKELPTKTTPVKAKPSTPKDGSPMKEKASMPGDKEEEAKEKARLEEESKAKLAEKRRQMREKKEREDEEARLLAEQKKREEEERIKREEEEQRRYEEEQTRLLAEAKIAEEERLRKAIEEEEKRKKEEDERLEQERKQKEEEERKRKEEAEKKEQERLERMKKEEEERLQRKKRLEMIMKRVKTDGPEKNKSEPSSPERSVSPNDVTVEPAAVPSPDQPEEPSTGSSAADTETSSRGPSPTEAVTLESIKDKEASETVPEQAGTPDDPVAAPISAETAATANQEPTEPQAEVAAPNPEPRFKSPLLQKMMTNNGDDGKPKFKSPLLQQMMGKGRLGKSPIGKQEENINKDLESDANPENEKPEYEANNENKTSLETELEPTEKNIVAEETTKDDYSEDEIPEEISADESSSRSENSQEFIRPAAEVAKEIEDMASKEILARSTEMNSQGNSVEVENLPESQQIMSDNKNDSVDSGVEAEQMANVESNITDSIKTTSSVIESVNIESNNSQLIDFAMPVNSDNLQDIIQKDSNNLLILQSFGETKEIVKSETDSECVSPKEKSSSVDDEKETDTKEVNNLVDFNGSGQIEALVDITDGDVGGISQSGVKPQMENKLNGIHDLDLDTDMDSPALMDASISMAMQAGLPDMNHSLESELVTDNTTESHLEQLIDLSSSDNALPGDKGIKPLDVDMINSNTSSTSEEPPTSPLIAFEENSNNVITKDNNVTEPVSS